MPNRCKETLCCLCGKPTEHSLWCDKCLEPYRRKGEEWEAIEAANKIVVKRRKETLSW